MLELLLEREKRVVGYELSSLHLLAPPYSTGIQFMAFLRRLLLSHVRARRGVSGWVALDVHSLVCDSCPLAIAAVVWVQLLRPQ